MTVQRMVLTVVAVALEVVLAHATSSAWAQVVAAGTLAGKTVFAVKGCGRDEFMAAFGLALAPDGTWAAQPTEGPPFGGTWMAAGASGRRFTLAFDAVSSEDFLAGIASDASELCEATATITSATPRRFVLVLNRRHTKATLTLAYRLRGTAGGRSGSARYTMHARGAWTE